MTIDWRMVIGLAVTIFPGFGVGYLVRHVGKLFTLLPPNQETAEQWAELRKLEGGGWWVGLLERPIFFAAFWVPNA